MTFRGPLTPRRLRDLMTSALDKRYAALFAPVARAIDGMARPGSPAAVAMSQLAAAAIEAQRAGRVLAATAPEVRAVVALIEDALARHRVLLDTVADDLMRSGATAGATIARQMAFPGVSAAALRGIGVTWNTPNLDAVLRTLDYQRGPAWGRLLGTYQDDVLRAANARIVATILHGRNPRAAVASLTRIVPGLARNRAESIARTVQLQSYRYSTSINYVANANILEPYAVRVAALDDRVCPGCVALHGTRVPIDRPINEHWRGRCTTVPVVRGQQFSIRTGEDWFAAQPAETQQRMLGGARYRAWSAGAVQLREFAQTTQDDVFGEMLTTASLRGVLGEAARDYYAAR